MNLGHLTLQSHRGWGRELGNVCEEDCGRSCDGRRTGVQRRWPGCGHRECGTTYARRRGDAVAARSRPWGRWGLLGPWQRSRLGRPWRLRLRRKLGLRSRVGLHHRSVWTCHLVSLVCDRRGCGSVAPAASASMSTRRSRPITSLCSNLTPKSAFKQRRAAWRRVVRGLHPIRRADEAESRR